MAQRSVIDGKFVYIGMQSIRDAPLNWYITDTETVSVLDSRESKVKPFDQLLLSRKNSKQEVQKTILATLQNQTVFCETL
jgi:hypothetical protein